MSFAYQSVEAGKHIDHDNVHKWKHYAFMALNQKIMFSAKHT